MPRSEKIFNLGNTFQDMMKLNFLYLTISFLMPLVSAGGKRGLLYDWTVQQLEPHPIDYVTENIQYKQISRVLNWNCWTPANLNGLIPFIPTIRTPAQLQGQEWEWACNSPSREILFWNEPERIPVSPQDAANAWFDHMVPLRQKTGKQLIGPSVANDDNGKRWLEQFMSLIDSQKPDFLGAHVYDTDGNRAIAYLKELRAKYNLPIYVTEIASVARNYVDVLYFTAQLANWMDQTSWIECYFFFGWMPKPADNFVSPAAQLMNSDGKPRDLMMKLMWDRPIVANWEEVQKGQGVNSYR